MNSHRPGTLIVRCGLGLLLLALCSCSDDDSTPADPGLNPVARSSCVDCHTNPDLLAELAVEPPPPTGDAGEG